MPPASVNQFLCRFWGVASESREIPLNVHSSSQTNTENTTNPRCHPAEILYVAFERSSCFQPRLHPPPSCFLSFRPSAFLQNFVDGCGGRIETSHFVRVVCFILVVLLCRLHRNPRRNGRAPDGKRANDGLFRSLCNSFNI